ADRFTGHETTRRSNRPAALVAIVRPKRNVQCIQQHTDVKRRRERRGSSSITACRAGHCKSYNVLSSERNPVVDVTGRPAVKRSRRLSACPSQNTTLVERFLCLNPCAPLARARLLNANGSPGLAKGERMYLLEPIAVVPASPNSAVSAGRRTWLIF